MNVLKAKPEEADRKTIDFIRKFVPDLGLTGGLRARREGLTARFARVASLRRFVPSDQAVIKLNCMVALSESAK